MKYIVIVEIRGEVDPDTGEEKLLYRNELDILKGKNMKEKALGNINHTIGMKFGNALGEYSSINISFSVTAKDVPIGTVAGKNDLLEEASKKLYVDIAPICKTFVNDVLDDFSIDKDPYEGLLESKTIRKAEEIKEAPKRLSNTPVKEEVITEKTDKTKSDSSTKEKPKKRTKLTKGIKTGETKDNPPPKAKDKDKLNIVKQITEQYVKGIEETIHTLTEQKKWAELARYIQKIIKEDEQELLQEDSPLVDRLKKTRDEAIKQATASAKEPEVEDKPKKKKRKRKPRKKEVKEEVEEEPKEEPKEKTKEPEDVSKDSPEYYDTFDTLAVFSEEIEEEEEEEEEEIEEDEEE